MNQCDVAPLPPLTPPLPPPRPSYHAAHNYPAFHGSGFPSPAPEGPDLSRAELARYPDSMCATYTACHGPNEGTWNGRDSGYLGNYNGETHLRNQRLPAGYADAYTQTSPLSCRRPSSMQQRRRSLSPHSTQPHQPSPRTRDRIEQLRRDAFNDLSRTAQDYNNQLVARMRHVESLPFDQQRALLLRLRNEDRQEAQNEGDFGRLWVTDYGESAPRATSKTTPTAAASPRSMSTMPSPASPSSAMSDTTWIGASDFNMQRRDASTSVDGLASQMCAVTVKDYSDVLKYQRFLETDPFHTDELDTLNTWQPAWADHEC